MKQKLKTGDEVDAICARHHYSWKSGTLKKIKRALNKRFRREWIRESRGIQQMENNLMKTKCLSIDALRDDYGWTWNNWYTIDDAIYLSENISNRELIKFARDDMGLLNDNSKGKVTVDDDGYNLVIIDKSTHEPLFAFCYGEYE